MLSLICSIQRNKNKANRQYQTLTNPGCQITELKTPSMGILGVGGNNEVDWGMGDSRGNKEVDWGMGPMRK